VLESNELPTKIDYVHNHLTSFAFVEWSLHPLVVKESQDYKSHFWNKMILLMPNLTLSYNINGIDLISSSINKRHYKKLHTSLLFEKDHIQTFPFVAFANTKSLLLDSNTKPIIGC